MSTLKCFIPLVGFEFAVENDGQRARVLTVKKKLEVNHFKGVTLRTGLGVFRRLSASAYHLKKSILDGVLYCVAKIWNKTQYPYSSYINKCTLC